MRKSDPLRSCPSSIAVLMVGRLALSVLSISIVMIFVIFVPISVTFFYFFLSIWERS